MYRALVMRFLCETIVPVLEAVARTAGVVV